ncbi:hypothetical protein Sjap_024472 [Stephania japonica]|uniref:Uncharacterized protein n=1 Tax=Stephania japonica TaxID=461633 RepID=A0AAP0EFL5_9MAGN
MSIFAQKFQNPQAPKPISRWCERREKRCRERKGDKLFYNITSSSFMHEFRS